MLLGLILSGCILPLASLPASVPGAGALMLFLWPALGMTITPSLAFMAQAAAAARLQSYGLVYGLYNLAWGVGLLSGPAAGGFLLDRIGFGRLALLWGVGVLVSTLLIARASRTAPPGTAPAEARKDLRPAVPGGAEP
ncbi:MAG: hypothetical protein H0V09_03950 [Gemmatimonadetes bacterium]|nr:hypothetical protein [Gemmatimonadota bacterium]